MFATVAVALLAATSAFAAPVFNTTTVPRGCASHKTQEQIIAAESDFHNRLQLASTEGFSAAAVEDGVIPVYWHVIQASDALTDGNVPDSQVVDNIKVMNEHYAGTGISFNLVKTDHITNKEWFTTVGPDGSGEALQTAMKTQLRQGGPETLNVYTVGFQSGDAQGLLGYATFPSDYKSTPKDDGVVILYSSLPGGSTKNYDEGKTLTHEVGHWLGLYHVFQGGCSGSGDQVDDTPPQSTATSGCPASQDSCSGGGVDSIHNYMDYSYDSCMNELSKGQITRFLGQIKTYRSITPGGTTPPPTTSTSSSSTSTTSSTSTITSTSSTSTSTTKTSTKTSKTKTSKTSTKTSTTSKNNCPGWWPNCPWANW